MQFSLQAQANHQIFWVHFVRVWAPALFRYSTKWQAEARDYTRKRCDMVSLSLSQACRVKPWRLTYTMSPFVKLRVTRDDGILFGSEQLARGYKCW